MDGFYSCASRKPWARFVVGYEINYMAYIEYYSTEKFYISDMGAARSILCDRILRPAVACYMLMGTVAIWRLTCWGGCTMLARARLTRLRGCMGLHESSTTMSPGTLTAGIWRR